MKWQRIPRVRRDADGGLRVAFPPPRGSLSFVVLALSGLILAVSGLGSIMVLAAQLPLPATLAATLLISAASFAAVAVDRRLAKSRGGLSIKLAPVGPGRPAHYEIYRGRSLLERETLAPDKLALTTVPLPGGPAGAMLPAFVLVLFPLQVDEQYGAAIAGRWGYILLHGDLRFPNQLYERAQQICHVLGIDMVQTATVEENLIANSE